MSGTPVYFDLYRELRENTAFNARVCAVVDKITAAEIRKDKTGVNAAIMELLRLCDNNFALLLPYFFPDFTEGKPMTLNERPFAYALMGSALGGSTVVQASRQVGKCLAGSTGLACKKDGVQCKMSVKEMFERAKSKQAP